MFRTYGQLAEIVAGSYHTAPSIQVDDNVRALIVEDDRDIIVACPGTTDLEGWLRDLRTWPEFFTGIGPCHEGFGQGGIELHRNIAFKLPTTKRVTYTGHSLGAAYAQVMAARHAMWHHAPCRCIVFGSPRVATFFNPIFHIYVAQALDLKLFANIGDVVPGVPGAPLYLHARAPTVLGMVPAMGGVFANHHIGLYQKHLSESPVWT